MDMYLLVTIPDSDLAISRFGILSCIYPLFSPIYPKAFTVSRAFLLGINLFVFHSTDELHVYAT